MKILVKKKLSDGRRKIYLFGVKVASYKQKRADTNRVIMGENNVVNIPTNSRIKAIIYGNNNKIIVGNHKFTDLFTIKIGTSDCHCDNCTIIIGDDFSCNGAVIQILEDNTTINIGNDCMLSDKITIWASDTHSITDSQGTITNIGNHITIGNHVWVGFGATILKNTTIADNCVIGTHCIVAGTFSKHNCIIAGNPGKIVKENIHWDRRRPKQYIIDTKNEPY